MHFVTFSVTVQVGPNNRLPISFCLFCHKLFTKSFCTVSLFLNELNRRLIFVRERHVYLITLHCVSCRAGSFHLLYSNRIVMQAETRRCAGWTSHCCGRWRNRPVGDNGRTSAAAVPDTRQWTNRSWSSDRLRVARTTSSSSDSGAMVHGRELRDVTKAVSAALCHQSVSGRFSCNLCLRIAYRYR